MNVRNYLMPILGAAAIALSFGASSAMVVTFSGVTGKCLEQEIYAPQHVDLGAAGYLNHCSDLNQVGAKGMRVIQQPVRHGENLIVDIWW